MDQGAALELELRCVCLGHEAFEGVLVHLYSDAHLAGESWYVFSGKNQDYRCGLGIGGV